MKKVLSVLFVLSITISAFAQTVVKTSAGYIKGITEGQAVVFKGIPYAKPPIDALRFKAPQPVDKWKDTLLCDRFGSSAAQYSGNTKGLQGDESSLFLNVYTPLQKPAHKMPVVVWVHGGGMTGGTGATMNGHAFADRDSIVTVTINYRLGVFGFLYLGDIDKAYQTSGNNGMLDMLMALKWVKQNIKSFGGDADNVTVMGESAGAKLVSTLLTSDKSKGLYKQLVLESGGVQCVRDTTTAKAIRQRLLKELNLQKPADLLTLPTAQLIEAQNKILNGAAGTNYFGPVQDGAIIKDDPYHYMETHNFKDKRFLIGSNKRESVLFMNADKRLYHPDSTVLKDWYGNNYPFVLNAYNKYANAIGPDSAAVFILTQYMYQMHQYRMANILTIGNNNVWMYRFDYSKDGKGAVHADELAYVWYVPGKHNNGFNEQLAEQVHAYWISFIKGRPTPNWKQYQPGNKVMIFNNVSGQESLKDIYNDPQYPSAGFVLN